MSSQRSVRRTAGSIEESAALRLDVDKAEQVVEALNTDLAGTYVAYHQVKKHHWNVEGAEFLELHKYLGEVAADLEEGADEIAERVQALGGVPVSGMTDLESAAPVEPEDADVYDIRTSLRNDMELCGQLIETLRDHIQMTENLGDYTSGEILRRSLETVEEHAHHFEHYLEDDTLVYDDALDR